MCSLVPNTLCDPMNWSPPVSSVHRIFQAWMLDWVAISYSGGSSPPRDGSCISWVSCLIDDFFYHCATWEAHMVSLHEYIFKRCHPNPQEKASCSRPKIKSVVNKSSPAFNLPIWCLFLSWTLRLWSQPGQKGGPGTVLILLWVWVWPVSVLGPTGALFLQPLHPGPCCCHVAPLFCYGEWTWGPWH